MTNEEAYNRIDAIIARHEIDDDYVTITSVLDYDALRLARKALEQESILDKIRAEIIDKSYLSYDNNPRHIIDESWVLEIIDKYKEEGGGEE